MSTQIWFWVVLPEIDGYGREYEPDGEINSFTGISLYWDSTKIVLFIMFFVTTKKYYENLNYCRWYLVVFKLNFFINASRQEKKKVIKIKG